MTTTFSHDPARAAYELREQISSEKRVLGFFMGAGTSMAVGMPGIEELTRKVFEGINRNEKTLLEKMQSGLEGAPNVEDLLNRVRIYRELLETSVEKEIGGLNKKTAKKLDMSICRSICDLVSVKDLKEIPPHLIYAQWLKSLPVTRPYPVEIFTTNYDLLLEKALESVGLPFFDGFVGAVLPFFVPESVEADQKKKHEQVYPPTSWTRLWKVHGSVNWFLIKDTLSGHPRIARLTAEGRGEGDEIMIFPSRDKYVESRKLPFISFQDRLRKFLSSGESLLFIVGYSFSDEHLNEIILQGLRSNGRLSVNVLFFGEEQEVGGSKKLTLSEKIVEYGRMAKNLSIYGPDKAVIGGVLGDWELRPKDKDISNLSSFWDTEKSRFLLGDFCGFAKYLEKFVGLRQDLVSIESPSIDETISEG